MIDYADRLLLSLRTCTTHPAGPLLTMSLLHRAVKAGEVDASTLEEEVRQRVVAQQLPPDRKALAEDYLAVIFHGVSS